MADTHIHTHTHTHTHTHVYTYTRCVTCPKGAGTRRSKVAYTSVKRGLRRSEQCDSSDNENKFMADILSYFTGQPAAPQKFGFCMPSAGTKLT
jgi:hypothetical protein